MINILNIPIRKEIEAIIENIRKSTGHDVLFIKKDALKSIGASGIIDNIPHVFLKTPIGLTEYNIAHELCHLECESNKFPRTKTSPNSTLLDITSTMLSELQSIIEHQLIFPQLITFGFDPYYETELIVQEHFLPKLCTSNPFSNISPFVKRLYLTVEYARILLEVPQGNIKTTIDNWFQKYSLPEKSEAQKLKSTIMSCDLHDRQKYRKVLVACISNLKCPKSEYIIYTYKPPKI